MSTLASIVRSTVSRKFWQWYVHVEPEQVVAQQAVEKLLFPGEGSKDLAIGPGNVPELGDDQSWIAFLSIRGSRPK